jgi:hypothetical protein
MIACHRIGDVLTRSLVNVWRAVLTIDVRRPRSGSGSYTAQLLMVIAVGTHFAIEEQPV